MDMTVHAIQQMGLVSASERLGASTARVVAECTRYLKRLPTTSTDVRAQDADSLCTWRPAAVVDLFVLLSQHERRTVVGLSMCGPDGECSGVQYYKPSGGLQELVSKDGDIVLLGQMTFDECDNGSALRPMLLIYDGFRTAETKTSAQQRYATLQAMQAQINALVFGSVQCVLQWVGSTESHSRIASMRLPHSTSGFVVLRDNLRHVLAPFAGA